MNFYVNDAIRKLILSEVEERKMNYFISQEIFNWHNMSSTQCYNGENIKECYDYLNHAESLIVDFKDKFHIQDAIRNLKVVVDKRIKQIERVYDFKSYFPKQHILEIYKELGIVKGFVKGFVIRKLFTIRNDIEHNELDYSDAEQCHDLVDTIWYFLKSTDEIVYTANTGIELSKDGNIENEEIWIGIDIDSSKMKVVKIRGRVDKDFLSKERFENAIKIENVEIKKVDKERVYFNGNIVLTNDIKVLMAKKVFINRIPIGNKC